MIRRLVLATLLAVCFAVVAQESETQDTEATQARETQSDTQATQNANNQEGSSAQSSDYFDPTEDISEDYAVPFPTDI